MKRIMIALAMLVALGAIGVAIEFSPVSVAQGTNPTAPPP